MANKQNDEPLLKVNLAGEGPEERKFLLEIKQKQSFCNPQATLEEKYKGCRHKLSKMVQETQGEIDCFV